MAIKAKHRKNLLKLAAYLEALPENYAHFDMEDYMVPFEDAGGVDYSSPCKVPHDCGTVACAIGHGPSAGIPGKGHEGWGEYCDRVFGTTGADELPFEYLFSSGWQHYDNTPKGAAARIRTYVALGHAPKGWSFHNPMVQA